MDETGQEHQPGLFNEVQEGGQQIVEVERQHHVGQRDIHLHHGQATFLDIQSEGGTYCITHENE